MREIMNQEKILSDILETVGFLKESVIFLKDNMASKEDLRLLERALRRDLASKEDLEIVKFDLEGVKEEVRQVKEDAVTFKDEILTRVDGFITLHQKLDTEITALRSQYNRLEQKSVA